MLKLIRRLFSRGFKAFEITRFIETDICKAMYVKKLKRGAK